MINPNKLTQKNRYSLGTSKPITSKTRYFEKRYFETRNYEIPVLLKTYYIEYP